MKTYDKAAVYRRLTTTLERKAAIVEDQIAALKKEIRRLEDRIEDLDVKRDLAAWDEWSDDGPPLSWQRRS